MDARNLQGVSAEHCIPVLERYSIESVDFKISRFQEQVLVLTVSVSHVVGAHLKSMTSLIGQLSTSSCVLRVADERIITQQNLFRFPASI